MTRFVNIADTHLGGAPEGYQQQKRYPEKLLEVLAALREYLATADPVDFVLHGGDMLEETTDDGIVAAVEAFGFPIPLYLCLGNHDLTVSDGLERWLSLAPGFFPGGRAEYTITTPDCLIHVVPNHWEGRSYYFDTIQDAHFRDEQIAYLDDHLVLQPDVPHIILTHSPVYGIPAAQTGFPEARHVPESSFTAGLEDLVARHRNIRCVLGAHTHVNTQGDAGGVEFVTASALVETPFEFKLFDVTPEAITMSTISLAEAMGFRGDYDNGKAFVQG